MVTPDEKYLQPPVGVVCRHCGEPITYKDEFGEWMHGNEPLCRLPENTLERASEGHGIWAEPVPVVPETPRQAALRDLQRANQASVAQMLPVGGIERLAETPEPEGLETGWANLRDTKPHLNIPYGQTLFEAGWDAAVKATAERCAQIALDVVMVARTTQRAAGARDVLAGIRAVYGEGKPE